MLAINPRADRGALHAVTEDFLKPLDRTGVALLASAIASPRGHDIDLIARDLLALAEEEAYSRHRASWIDPLIATFHACSEGSGFGGTIAHKALDVLSHPFDDAEAALTLARRYAAQAADLDPRFVPFAAALDSLELPRRSGRHEESHPHRSH